MLAAAGVLLAGCSSDVTAPAESAMSTLASTSPFRPTAAQKALVGVTDGVYTFTIDPKTDQSLQLGPNHLDLPANAVCDLEKSGYGVRTWNKPCDPETSPVTITAIVKDAATDHPSIDFYPAMRFNPRKNVALYFYVPTGQKSFASNWTMNYCPTAADLCYDESKSDKDLRTFVDKDARVVFRRIKHFSGYVVAERGSSLVDAL